PPARHTPPAGKIAGNGHHPHAAINPDVRARARQRDLRDPITDGRNQYVTRHKSRRDIAELRNETDDCIETESPINNRNAELVVHQLREDFQLSLDLNG